MKAADRPYTIDVRFFAPPADLAPFFSILYRVDIACRGNAVVEDLLQPEWANLRFFGGNLPSARMMTGAAIDGARFAATGPSSCPTHFRLGTTRLWGIGLLPLGWARFVARPANAYVNTIVDGERSEAFAQFSPLCRHLCRTDLDEDEQFSRIVAFFRDHGSPPRDEARIRLIHEEMADPHLLNASDFADRVGLTLRTLERVCLRHFGFPPRMLLRRQRMMRSLAAFMLEDNATWSRTIDRHYHDQAHFVREFHGFMHMGPSEYAGLDHPILGEFMAERQRVWGSPAQSLDESQ